MDKNRSTKMKRKDSIREVLSKKIAGEIVLSSNPGLTIRKWRTILEITQVEVSKELNCSPSVISDYEVGRRRSPGRVERIPRIAERAPRSRGTPPSCPPPAPAG